MSQVHVELLTYARDRYAEAQRVGLCLYLNDAAERFGGGFEAAQIKNHITKLLSGSMFLEDWLQDVQGVPTAELYGNNGKDPERVVATRVAWANWLIEQWRDEP